LQVEEVKRKTGLRGRNQKRLLGRGGTVGSTRLLKKKMGTVDDPGRFSFASIEQGLFNDGATKWG
jgi:hypothetical protein